VDVAFPSRTFSIEFGRCISAPPYFSSNSGWPWGIRTIPLPSGVGHPDGASRVLRELCRIRWEGGRFVSSFAPRRHLIIRLPRWIWICRSCPNHSTIPCSPNQC
jgi:hypothetical protein